MFAAVVREHGELNGLLERDFPNQRRLIGSVAVSTYFINFHDIFSRRGMPGAVCRCRS